MSYPDAKTNKMQFWTLDFANLESKLVHVAVPQKLSCTLPGTPCFQVISVYVISFTVVVAGAWINWAPWKYKEFWDILFLCTCVSHGREGGISLFYVAAYNFKCIEWKLKKEA